VPRGSLLDVRPLAGISSYEPTELVVTARAGTPLADLEAVLAERGQCLPFEPPRFNDHGTVGGMVAAGLAGPARAQSGSVRDYVLGLTLLNGKGEVLSFGGQVIKNVAGYDVSRLMAGSLGVLGVICEVSLKVLPLPIAQTTLEFDLDAGAALDWCNRWRSRPLPVTASSWHQGRLRVRLAGATAAVRAAGVQLGGHAVDANEAAAWWRDVRDQRTRFFTLDAEALAAGECLWRLSLPPDAALLEGDAQGFIDWGGAQRWWRTRATGSEVRARAARAGGHATLYRAADRSGGVFAPLSPALLRIHRNLKAAFDPAAVFNPGRLYADL
jgi:FAD/FMN-containing dehydrogenase